MALQHLTDEQVRTWTREQKDQWWFKNIFRGDLPQLTLRSALTGFLLGGILSATNLYIGGKTGVSLGVGLTSVILAFAMFKVLSRIGLGGDFTILENNAMQSIATAAGYMTSPLIASLAAYMLIANRIVPWWQLLLWNVVLSILGVLVAFPMKRRFINDEQQPFPEGRACGVVLDTLYNSDAHVGLFKARVLAISAAAAGFLQFLMGEGFMKLIQFRILGLDEKLGWTSPWHLRERIDDYYYLLAAKYDYWIPKILGTDIRELGLRVGFDVAMIGVGGLMGIRVAGSVLIGTLVNFVVLAPWMIERGDIVRGVAADGTLMKLSRAEIVNQWSLWWGITMMVVASLVALFARPKVILGAFKGMFSKKAARGPDVVAHIELPLWVSYVGVPVFGFLASWMAHDFFGVKWYLALLALPLIFVLTLIATNAMALTSWTPTGSLSKITQFTFGAIERGNPAVNLMTAGMTAEVASNAANLLSDIKPGYMLGAKPRQQAMGHVIGIFAGALASTPLFFLLFLPKQDGVRSVSTLLTDEFPMPAAVQWKGVADLISHGISGLPMSAVISMAVAAVLAIVFEVLRITTKGRFPLSAISIGLGVVLPPDACLAMFAGAFVFWTMGRRNSVKGTRGNELWVECVEPICAGLIAGAALIGIGNAIVNVLI